MPNHTLPKSGELVTVCLHAAALIKMGCQTYLKWFQSDQISGNHLHYAGLCTDCFEALVLYTGRAESDQEWTVIRMASPVYVVLDADAVPSVPDSLCSGCGIARSLHAQDGGPITTGQCRAMAEHCDESGKYQHPTG